MSDSRDPQQSVLWLSYPFPPAVSAGVFRSVRFVKYLPEFGWKPLVFTVTPDERFPTDDSLSNYLPADLVIESCPIWRPGEWKQRLFGKTQKNGCASRPKSPTADEGTHPTQAAVATRPEQRSRYQELRRRLLATPDEKIWWARPAYYKALKLIRQHRPKVIFSTAPPHSSHLLGLWLKRKTGLPLVLDFRDPWTRSPWGGTKNAYLDEVNCRLERECVEGADAVILNTERTRDEFAGFYGPAQAAKFHTIYNGYDPSLREEIEKLTPAAALTARGPSTTLRLCHVGTIYGRREIRPLLEALSRLVVAGGNIAFEQVGIVKVDYDLPTYLKQHGLESNVCVIPPVTHSEALERMAGADVLLLLQPDGQLQVPGKLFEMIMFRKPILALTGEGATRDLVSKYRLGPIADPHDVSEMIGVLTSLASGGVGENADWEGALAEFNGRNQTGALAKLFAGITGHLPTYRVEPH